jgi:hypothetical protein
MTSKAGFFCGLLSKQTPHILQELKFFNDLQCTISIVVSITTKSFRF